MDEVVQETNTETGSTEVAPAQEAAPVEAPSKKEAGVETSSPEVGADGKPVAPKPVFTPNYKLKVYDQETELNDPFLKQLIKDADSEKKVKEIAQKFLGFDVAKEKAEKVRTEYAQYKEQAQPVVDYYKEATNLLNKGDLESFFELVGIPTQAIYQYAVKKAQEAQLPQEQQAYMQQQREIAKQKEYLESQNQTLLQQQQMQAQQFRQQELMWQLSRPEVKSVAQAYEAKNGQGQFAEYVREIALSHFAKTGYDLTGEQAVTEAMKRIQPFMGLPAQATPGMAQAPQLIQQGEAPPIIPNITGRGSSPVKKRVTSIDDLKKRYEEVSSS